MSKRGWIVAALSAVCAAALWAQGLVICKACGREAKPGETVCSHCKTALPLPKEEAPQAAAPVEVDVNKEISQGAWAVVESCVRQARELEEKQPEVALCYYQNALALMRLVAPGTCPDSAGDAILKGNGRAMQALLRGPVQCRRCKGTGKYQLDVSKVDKTGGIKAVSGVACPACNGRGAFDGFREVAKVKMAVLQGRREFESREMVDGHVKVGRAYVPAELEKRLSNSQRALVMTGMPVPCSECQLTGRQACTACKSTGWVKCDYAGCTQGVVKESRQGSSRQAKRLNDELLRKCPKCNGLAEIPCAACKGGGSVPCKKCDGSGVAPRCSRCTGTGLMACTKCKGTGEVKGSPCPECKGEKMMMCTTCRGEGALAR